MNLSSTLSMLADLLDRLVGSGLAAERIALLGFSQGACPALDSRLRRAQRLGDAEEVAIARQVLAGGGSHAGA
jgi:predicted esterase